MGNVRANSKFGAVEQNEKEIAGFSKLNKRDKIYWLAKNFLYANPVEVLKEFAEYWHDNIEAQKLLDGFSENTLTNFPVPFGIAPNFKINDTVYAIPMVTEESSVVAAASQTRRKYWLTRGGFQAQVLFLPVRWGRYTSSITAIRKSCLTSLIPLKES